MSKGQHSFVKGAAILGGAGLIVKFLGAIFRIPLTLIIGTDGMANYAVAYQIYIWLIVIATAGLPVAISRMVSERVTVGDYRGAHKVFQRALKILFLIGVVSTIVMLILAAPIANGAKIPSAKLGVMLIAPSLFFVALLSAYRGYFQGLQSMTPTAVTQLIEQAVKLGAGLYLASLWYTPEHPELGAAGALLGVTISEVCAFVLILGIYNRKKKDIKLLKKQNKTTFKSKHKSIGSELIQIAFPIIIGASIMPVINLLDQFIINNVMPTVDYSAFNLLSAKDSFGALTGYVNPLINMPAVLSLALCMSLVPAISEARTNKNRLAVSSRSSLGLKLAILIGLPCSIGLFLLAQPIIDLLFSSKLNDPELSAQKLIIVKEGLRIGGEMLKTMSIGVLFLTMVQTMTGVLQGAGKQFIPVINLAVGAVVKIVLSILLIRIPSLNVNGAAIGTAACYGIAAILNIFFVFKHAKPNVKLTSGLLMPILSAIGMGLVVYFMYDSLLPSLGNTKATILCIAGAILVYVVMLFITGSLKKEDMVFIPGGSHVIRFMNRLGFWGE